MSDDNIARSIVDDDERVVGKTKEGKREEGVKRKGERRQAKKKEGGKEARQARPSEPVSPDFYGQP